MASRLRTSLSSVRFRGSGCAWPPTCEYTSHLFPPLDRCHPARFLRTAVIRMELLPRLTAKEASLDHPGQERWGAELARTSAIPEPMRPHRITPARSAMFVRSHRRRRSGLASTRPRPTETLHDICDTHSHFSHAARIRPVYRRLPRALSPSGQAVSGFARPATGTPGPPLDAPPANVFTIHPPSLKTGATNRRTRGGSASG
jgi:hypothetical protein